MHPLSGALPLPYVPARVTRGALVAHIWFGSHIVYAQKRFRS